MPCGPPNGKVDDLWGDSGLPLKTVVQQQHFGYTSDSQNTICMFGLQRNRVVMMQYVSRAACTAESQRAVTDAAAIEADCAQADMTIQVVNSYSSAAFGSLDGAQQEKDQELDILHTPIVRHCFTALRTASGSLHSNASPSQAPPEVGPTLQVLRKRVATFLHVLEMLQPPMLGI